jgi:hypothetical protein
MYGTIILKWNINGTRCENVTWIQLVGVRSSAYSSEQDNVISGCILDREYLNYPGFS